MKLSTNFKHNVRLIFIITDVVMIMLNHKLKTVSNSRVSRNDPYFSSEYKQYLCFSVFCSTNTLVFERSKHLWSEEQQKTHDTIKSLHDSGMGYRKISHYLNEQGIKTPKGNLWGGNNVHSVLKRNRERLQRLETQKQESKLEYGKMELVWLREGEL